MIADLCYATYGKPEVFFSLILQTIYSEDYTTGLQPEIALEVTNYW
jgi:hypothetical protein